MRILTTVLITNLCAAGVAFADDPPAPSPDQPAPPPEEPPKEIPANPDARPEVKPEPPKEEPKGVNIPSTPTDGAPISSSPRPFEDSGSGGSVSARGGGHKTTNPHLAVELSGAGGQLADPYIVYKGWTLENGVSKGTRLEGQLGGIMLAYELTAMSNTRACSDAGCLSGDFGSTTFHAVELGYRYRMNMIGPVRPFITASLGGVRGNAGGWATQSGASFGGVARAGFGVEIPIAGRFFASGVLSYRLMVMQNPYRSTEMDTVNKAFIGSEVPNGDYVDDAHVIGLNVGVGVSL